MFSLLLCLRVVWRRPAAWNQIWLLTVLGALCHEFSQRAWSGLGTFSWIDVEFYLLAAVAARIGRLKTIKGGECENDVELGEKTGCCDGGDRGGVCADWGGY